MLTTIIIGNLLFSLFILEFQNQFFEAYAANLKKNKNVRLRKYLLKIKYVFNLFINKKKYLIRHSRKAAHRGYKCLKFWLLTYLILFYVS